ncbi:myelin-oligodendrocyte glycoprotein-like isoform X5 [Acanthochromis polyacanthus]|uniref:myelin-oligodendrocyte glycoprotein-like isoform X5 n=1 Tax=Acanthochromis polyacanthus TaxID=80966 RepID=UPI002233EA4D|nr:myelin-oligodendrocyte glycoprotein-like isoform X5 [Acanthochromis polyacanthus]
MTQFSELHDASSKPWTQLSSFTALVFLLLTQNCSGLPQVVGPSQPVLATVGDDVILSCRLEPAVDASDMSIEWSREDLDPSYVYVWWDKEELESSKHPDYKGRTSLLFSKLEFGDVSLKISKVKLSDKGKYRCFIPTLGEGSTVELVVEDVFLSQSSYILIIVGSAAAFILLILAVVFFVRTTRQNRKRTTLVNEKQEELELLEKLQDEKQKWMKTVVNLKTELQNMNQELKLAGPITVEEVHQYGLYIRLKNISSEEIKLGGWRFELQINNREPDVLMFEESLKLQVEEILTIRSLFSSSKHADGVDLLWSELKNWRPEDNLQMNLISNKRSSDCCDVNKHVKHHFLFLHLK